MEGEQINHKEHIRHNRYKWSKLKKKQINKKVEKNVEKDEIQTVDQLLKL